MLDMIGQKIEVGDYVAYPGRSHSHMWMNISKVVGVINEKYQRELKVINKRSRNGRVSRFYSPERCIKLDTQVVMEFFQ